MSLRSWLNTQSLNHCAPLDELRLHLSLDLQRMVSNALCAPRLFQLFLEFQDATVEGEVVR